MITEFFNEVQSVCILVGPGCPFFGIACPQILQMCWDNFIDKKMKQSSEKGV